MEGVGSALRSVISRVKEATAKRSSVRVVFNIQCNVRKLAIWGKAYV